MKLQYVLAEMEVGIGGQVCRGGEAACVHGLTLARTTLVISDSLSLSFLIAKARAKLDIPDRIVVRIK